MAVKIEITKKDYTYNTEYAFALCANILTLIRESGLGQGKSEVGNNVIDIRFVPRGAFRSAFVDVTSAADSRFDNTPRDEHTIVRLAKHPTEDVWSVESIDALKKEILLGSVVERHFAGEALGQWMANLVNR